MAETDSTATLTINPDYKPTSETMAVSAFRSSFMSDLYDVLSLLVLVEHELERVDERDDDNMTDAPGRIGVAADIAQAKMRKLIAHIDNYRVTPA